MPPARDVRRKPDRGFSGELAQFESVPRDRRPAASWQREPVRPRAPHGTLAHDGDDARRRSARPRADRRGVARSRAPRDREPRPPSRLPPSRTLCGRRARHRLRPPADPGRGRRPRLERARRADHRARRGRGRRRRDGGGDRADGGRAARGRRRAGRGHRRRRRHPRPDRPRDGLGRLAGHPARLERRVGRSRAAADARDPGPASTTTRTSARSASSPTAPARASRT